MPIPALHIIKEVELSSDSDLPMILAAVVRECKKRKIFRNIPVSEVVAKLASEVKSESVS